MSRWHEEQEEPDHSADIERERRARQRIEEIAEYVAEELEDHIALLWNWGDGEGGYFLNTIRDAVCNRMGWSTSISYAPNPNRRKKISGTTKKIVFERDAYRCVKCSGYVDLCVDHKHPWSRGGTDDVDNLQTLCRSCNSRKGNKVEVAE